MEPVRALLDLPLATLAPLAAGYLGYRTAFIGRNGAHRAVDVVFLSLVFALVGKMVMVASGGWIIPGAVAAVAVTIMTAALWRVLGVHHVFAMLRRRRIVDHDGQPDVWRSMLARQDIDGANRITVRLKSGRHLLCNDTRSFNLAPMGAYLLGEDGSIALYVTHSKGAVPGSEWIEAEPLDQGFGYDMTFIPAAGIESVDLRRIG